MSKARDIVETLRTTVVDADIGTTVLSPTGNGSGLTNIDAVPTGTTLPSPAHAAASLFYTTGDNRFYISDGTSWSLVSNQGPTPTGGTVVIASVGEASGSYSYNLGIDFEDDVNTDAELIYTLESGTLPTGCVLPTAGNTAFTGTIGVVLSDTLFSFEIKATDASGAAKTQNYQQTITNTVPTITGGTVTITGVIESASMSYDVDTDFTFATNAVFSAYSLQSGTLPSGTSLNTATGVISGTASSVSSTTAYTFTIRATDTDGDTVDQPYSWVVSNVVPTATGGTEVLPATYTTATVSASAASQFTFLTAATLSAYSLQSGTLPLGLSLNTATGVISGTIGNIGVSDINYSFTIGATDTDGDTTNKPFTWDVSATIPPLYAFTTHTFTNAGATGRFGPSTTQINTAYSGSSVAGYVSQTNGTQLWTVPDNGTYRITANGAGGNNHSDVGANRGGYGASITGNITLTKGEVVHITVGQLGGYPTTPRSDGSAGGGGGGAFVSNAAGSPHIVAGGGTGQSYGDGWGSVNGIAAQLTVTNSGGSMTMVSSIRGGYGGSLSQVGPLGTGGLPPNATVTGMFGNMFGGLGLQVNYGSDGGFGCGGCTMYEGGGGGGHGGAGMVDSNSPTGNFTNQGAGSYNGGTSQVSSLRTSAGHGSVIISKI